MRPFNILSMYSKTLAAFIGVGVFVIVMGGWSSNAQAACADPAGIEGQQTYNSTYKVMQYCNGTQWIGMAGGSSGGSGGSGGGEGAAAIIGPWTDVKASRSCGTNYVNSGTGARLVAMSVQGAGGGVLATVDGVVVKMMSGYGGDTNMSGSILVPPGATYNIGCASIATLQTWHELDGVGGGSGGDGVWTSDGSFVYLDSGRVGIGTATPERVLHVVGTGDVDDDLIVESNNDTNSSGGIIAFYRSRGTKEAKTEPLTNDYLGSFSGRGWNGAGYAAGVGIDVRAETDWATEQSGYLSISTRANNVYNEKIRISSSGNIGIGTTDPQSKIQIRSLGAIDAGDNGWISIGSNAFYDGEWKRIDESKDSASLHINGTDFSEGSEFRFRITDTAGTSQNIAHIGTGGSWIVGNLGLGNNNARPNILTLNGPGDVASANSGGGLLIQDSSAAADGYKIRMDSNEMQASYNGAAGNYTLNPFGGRITIGSSGTPVDYLRVYGSGTSCVIGNGTGTTSCTSDRRLKENIAPLENALDKITALNGVSFDWKKSGEHTIGVIAQDVEKVFPELVTTDEETGLKSVAYPSLIAPLIEAVKTLKAQNEETNAQLQSLHSENAALRVQNETILNRLKALEEK